jgi:hypothetical protein
MATTYVSLGDVKVGAVVTSGNTLHVRSDGVTGLTNVRSGGIEQVDFGGIDRPLFLTNFSEIS